VWVYSPTEHKTKSRGHDRPICLGPKAQELLGPWLRADPNKPLFSPRESREFYDRNRPNGGRSTPEQRAAWRKYYRKANRAPASPREREMYSTRSYGNRVAEGCLKAGVPAFRCNRIRHTYATAVRKQFGLEEAQVLLGHKSADVTQVYAERDLTLAARVAAQIG
jgi:integrase